MHDHLLIGGEAVPGAGDPFDIVDPASGEADAIVGAASTAQVADAIGAARRAFPGWHRLPQDDRSAALSAIADLIDDHVDELVDMVTRETGRTAARNRVYVEWAATIFRQYAAMARHDRGRVVPSNDQAQLSLVLRSPYGVIACIAPYNYPLALMVHKAAPALAVGNTIVCKGAEETTRTTLFLGELMNEALPPGVVNVVAGGTDVGRALVAGDGVDLVAFTGSTAAGRVIGRDCADLARPALLELGGKDPAIVFSDADLDVAVPGVVWASYLNAGQVCTSTERVYVDRSLHDEFVGRASELAGSLRVGDPFDPTTQVGPMRSEVGRANVLEHLAEAQESGATLHVGGEPFGPGFFLRPAVVSGVDHSMKLMTEETFGPVLPVMAFDDDDQAFALATDTPYGLGASLYTSDARRVKRGYETIPVGNLWVNEALVDNQAAPFGGVRASGNTRELGIEGLHAFTYPKHVHWNIDAEVKPWWFGAGS
jgi:acyl-CoA reductase-like NAD-dependent aldehyde dehydrogenase